MDVIAYCKENYEYIQLQNALRFCGVLDIYKKKKTGKISVFIIPEQTWHYPQNDEEFSDLVISFLDYYLDNPALITKKSKPPKMKDSDPIPFGKHQGTAIGSVPPDYLIWLLENKKCYGAVKEYIQANLEVLKMQLKNDKRGIR
jgi:uncharacterized protein (DUF3820 family)